VTYQSSLSCDYSAENSSLAHRDGTSHGTRSHEERNASEKLKHVDVMKRKRVGCCASFNGRDCSRGCLVGLHWLQLQPLYLTCHRSTRSISLQGPALLESTAACLDPRRPQSDSVECFSKVRLTIVNHSKLYSPSDIIYEAMSCSKTCEMGARPEVYKLEELPRSLTERRAVDNNLSTACLPLGCRFSSIKEAIHYAARYFGFQRLVTLRAKTPHQRKKFGICAQ
jgi:hypothetical protein